MQAAEQDNAQQHDALSASTRQLRPLKRSQATCDAGATPAKTATKKQKTAPAAAAAKPKKAVAKDAPKTATKKQKTAPAAAKKAVAKDASKTARAKSKTDAKAKAAGAKGKTAGAKAADASTKTKRLSATDALIKYRARLLQLPAAQFAPLDGKWLSVYDTTLRHKPSKNAAAYEPAPGVFQPAWTQVLADVATQHGARVCGVLPHYAHAHAEHPSLMHYEAMPQWVEPEQVAAYHAAGILDAQPLRVFVGKASGCSSATSSPLAMTAADYRPDASWRMHAPAPASAPASAPAECTSLKAAAPAPAECASIEAAAPAECASIEAPADALAALVSAAAVSEAVASA